jgi:hypothetical protein
MQFSAFSPLNGGTPDTYYRDYEYPYDLNGSLDFVRPKGANAAFPFPVSIGYVQGLIPLADNLQFDLMRGQDGFGPWIGAYPNTAQQLAWVFPDMQGGLQKVKG